MMLVRKGQEPRRSAQGLEGVVRGQTLGNGAAKVLVAVDDEHRRLPFLEQVGPRRVVPLQAVEVVPHERGPAEFVQQAGEGVGLCKHVVSDNFMMQLFPTSRTKCLPVRDMKGGGTPHGGSQAP